MTTNELIVSHIYLAQRLARHKKKKLFSVSYDELESAAYLGLVEAANKYHSELSTPFHVYATPRILGAICDYLRELAWGTRSQPHTAEEIFEDSHPSSTIEEKSELFDKISKRLSSLNRRVLRLYYMEEFKIGEIAEQMGVHQSRVSQILSESRSCLRCQWSGQEAELWAEVA